MFDEDVVIDAGAEVDEGEGGGVGGGFEVVEGFGAGVGALSGEGAAAFDEFGVDGEFDFEDVDAVLGFRELGHAGGDDFGLLFGVFERFFALAGGVVADEFEEEGEVFGGALGADAFDEGVFDFVDFGVFGGGVVDEEFDGVGAPVLDAADGDVVEEVGEAAGAGVVVARGFVGEEEAAMRVAGGGGGQAVFGVEEEGGGVGAEDGGDGGFELLKHGRGGVGAEGFGETAALVHGGGGDDAGVVGERLDVQFFTGSEDHFLSLQSGQRWKSRRRHGSRWRRRC